MQRRRGLEKLLDTSIGHKLLLQLVVIISSEPRNHLMEFGNCSLLLCDFVYITRVNLCKTHRIDFVLWHFFPLTPKVALKPEQMIWLTSRKLEGGKSVFEDQRIRSRHPQFSAKLRHFFSNFQKVLFLHENWYFFHKKLGTKFLGIFSPTTILPKISHFFHSKWRSALRSAMVFQNVPQ